MKLSPIVRLFLLCLFIGSSATGNAQIYNYINDSVGNYSAVATHATGTGLGRINGAVSPVPACRYGFSSKSFSPSATFATSLPADTLVVSPNAGYVVKVTGFSVGIRRSNTGPDSVRFAYTTNGGTSWVNQGYSFSPNNAGCDSTITAVWTTTVTVAAPNHLEFAVFGYNATSTAGTFQIDTLTINGTVTSTASIISERINNDNDFIVYPNPAKDNATISYHLSQEETVSLDVYNILGREVRVVSSTAQPTGDHTYSVSIATPGIYFVRLTIGDAVFTRKVIRN